MGGGSTILESSSSDPSTAPPDPSSSPAATAVTHWDPSAFLLDSPALSSSQSTADDPTTATKDTLALLILNQEITHRERILTVWRHSNLRVCADGGANRLYSVFGDDEVERRAEYLPSCIIGDLDSLLPHVRDFYASRGVPVIKDPSQDSTDFGKALGWIDSQSVAGGDMTIVAWGGFGGRVDQSFHSVHALFYDRYENNPAASVAAATSAGAKRADAPKRHIFILSSISVTFLLFPGLNVISTPHRVLGKTCGIIPCGQPARITTKGLEWDLEDAETRFGGLVSTSNHLKEQEVRIWTDVEVVFTAEVRSGEEAGGRGG